MSKNGTNESICRAGIETDVENRLVDTVEEGEGVRIESSTETYTFPHVTS